jgi:hypothetical protein
MERPRTRALVLDDEAGSGGETAAKFTEKLSVSVRTHCRSPPAPHPASHAGHTPSCARMRGLTTIKSPRGAAQPALALDAAGAGAGTMQAGHHLRPLCAVWPGCIARSVRPPHHRPRESIWVAEAGRRLAAQQVWHRDGALWHHFSFSLTAVCGTGQYLCRSVPRSGPACHCWGCDHTEDPSGGLGGCQRVFSALLWVPQYTCFGALATLSPCVSMSLAIVFSDVLALVPLSGHPVTS